MEKENIQKELFEFDLPKKQPNRFGRFFQKADFAVSLNSEKLVFVTIGIIMLIVVSFALGVEKGKRLVSKQRASVSATEEQAIQPKMAVVQPKTAVAQPRMISATTNITIKEKTPAAAVKTAAAPYTIVAAAFSKEIFAAKEVGILKGSGMDAFVLKSEPYYLACAGSFADKESARAMLNKIKRMHKDAYVRLR